MEISNLYLLIISGFANIAFGLERIINHHLYAGGMFFLILALIVIVTAVYQLFHNFKDSEWKTKK